MNKLVDELMVARLRIWCAIFGTDCALACKWRWRLAVEKCYAALGKPGSEYDEYDLKT